MRFKITMQLLWWLSFMMFLYMGEPDIHDALLARLSS